MMEGRNSTTTGVHTAGVFSNDPYKSPEIGTAFSMTADEQHLDGFGGRSTAYEHKFNTGASDLIKDYDEHSLKERHSNEMA